MITSGQGRHAALNRRRTVQIILAIVGFAFALNGIIQDVRSHHVPLSLAVGLASWTVALALIVVRHRLLARDGHSGSAQDRRLERLAIMLCWLPVAVAIIANYLAHRGVEGWLIILIVLVGYTQWGERHVNRATEVDEAR